MNVPPEHKRLREVVGGWAYRALRNGRPLNIWRQSTPHNWWIEDARGRGYLWHSWPGEPYPQLELFENIGDSKERVIQYWGADSGRPSHSQYVLKEV